LSYSAKRKAIEHHQTNRSIRYCTTPDLSESLDPAKAIVEIKKVMMLRR
jgi:hypothetical protein